MAITLTDITTCIAEIGILLGVIIPVILFIVKIANGMKCQLRTEMLRTYYHNKDREKIRQYEYENFIKNYEAYKALKGNSFIDKIYTEVKTWEVIS
jgi:ABC-type lipoprotein release transport system permease subunit